MAVAVAAKGMGPNDAQNVHPFFRGRTIAQTQNVHEEFTNRQSKGHAKLAAVAPPLLPTTSSGKAATTIPNGDDLARHQTGRKAISAGSATAATTAKPLNRSVGSIVDHGGDENRFPVADVEQTAAGTGVSLGHLHDDPNLDTDPNYRRSKRRRTASPKRQSLLDTSLSNSTWQRQLEAAAYDKPRQPEKDETGPPSARANRETGNEDLTPETARHSTGSFGKQNPIPPARKVSEPVDPLVTGLPAGKPEEQAPRNDPPQPETPKKRIPTKDTSKQATPKKETPKRKMLKLNSDGKLGSPRSRAAAATNNRTRGKGRSSNAKGLPGVMIVIIKYGSSEESRVSMAQRIQDILVSTMPNQGTSAAAHAKPTKLPSPPKSTHPFFLGKSGRKAGQEQKTTDITVDEIDGAGSKPARDENSSPKKVKFANGARARAEAWAALAGFGARPMGQHDLRASKIPGAETPLWPPKDMLHIRDLPSSSVNASTTLHKSHTPPTQRKMKDAVIQIPEQEDLFHSFTRKLHGQANGTGCQVADTLRLPIRRVMTRSELQQAVRLRLTCAFPATLEPVVTGTDELHDSQIDRNTTHNALLRLYSRLAVSQSAFDQAECETQAWVHKYAPKWANDVLQQGREAIFLRDWLKSLTVTSVDSGNKDSSSTRESSVASKRHNPKLRKKKRRRAEGLDGFVISSDEEATELDELTDPEGMSSSQGPYYLPKKTVIRAGDTLRPSRTSSNARTTNAVVISGPHGCGKTAAVYALAHELDFEVFEINAGSRRSGKDLLDKVGDMTRNHLVHRSNDTETVDANEDILRLTDSLKQDLESGRQANMKSFFKPKLESRKRPKTKAVMKTNQLKVEQPPRKQKNQKQSLILLEEVDVLFDEDKQFWMTTLSLILQSKRPIIMTCTDENLLPLDEMALYGIFRLTPPPEAVVTDYLLLMAANEGHLLSPDAMLALYRCKRCDIRASITELQFYCQIGIGDTKGGLEWMLIGMSADEALKSTHGVLRVVSEGTYLKGMGWLGRDYISTQTGLTESEGAELLFEAWNEWGICPEDHQTFEVSSECPTGGGQRPEEASLEAWQAPKTQEHLKALEEVDQAFEALSASDIFPGLGFRCDDTVSAIVNCLDTRG